MTTYSWQFGAAGSGVYAVVFYDTEAQVFTINNLEGAMDVNALWFSDGDKVAGEGGVSLTKSEKSLSIDSLKIAWDDVAKLSMPGLGKEGMSKPTYLSSGEAITYSMADMQSAGLNTSWITDWSNITMGLRATSVDGPTDSVKLADASPTVVITSSDVTHQINWYGTTLPNYLQGDLAGPNGATMESATMAGETTTFGHQAILLPADSYAYAVGFGDVMYAGAAHGGTVNFGNDTIYGGANTDYITGDTDADYASSTYPGGGTYNFGADQLIGNGGDDQIYGDARQLGNFPSLPDAGAPYQGTYNLGNDYVNGGTGNDQLYGDIQQGNSGVFTFGHDIVLGGSGSDYMVGDVDWLLAFSDPITAVAGNDTMSGGEDDDIIVGDGVYVGNYDVGSSVTITCGNDVLKGDAGNDYMIGDIYNVWGDPYGLGADPTKVTYGNDQLSGGDGDDILVGDAYWVESGVIVLGGGKDTLNGGAGNDYMVGGAGADDFVFSTALDAATNMDVIEDFSSAEGDRIVLDDAVFVGLTNANLAAALGTKILYDDTTGVVSFDADGVGPGGAVEFAVLGNMPATLAASDFWVV